jgi:putative Mg2+ transporter-C (MgtC) family protein
MIDMSEIALRLCTATLVGGALGLNRDLHGKPTGVRTLGIVALGSALVAMTAGDLAGATDANAVSRAIQGVITGIGFLGAGVILHPLLKEASGDAKALPVQGLTTASCIWLTACIGLSCGIGAWRAIAVALPLVFLILLFGRRIERTAHRWMKKADDDTKV